jgi:hypothetical protein
MIGLGDDWFIILCSFATDLFIIFATFSITGFAIASLVGDSHSWNFLSK